MPLWETVFQGDGVLVERQRMPGGWWVSVSPPPSDPYEPVTFWLPDQDHQWNGSILEPAFIAALDEVGFESAEIGRPGYGALLGSYSSRALDRTPMTSSGMPNAQPAA